DRLASAWKRKREAARKQKALLTRTLPGWLRLDKDGRPEIVPGRDDTVRRVFEMAANGAGAIRITRTLDAEGHKPFGSREHYVDPHGSKRTRRVGGSYGNGKWSKDNVGRLLRDRRLLGEYQPMKGRKPDGPPVEGIFPAVITEDEWHAAEKGRTGRDRKM